MTVGVIFSSDDLAIFSKFKGVTTITFAGRTAILVVSAIWGRCGCTDRDRSAHQFKVLVYHISDASND